MLYKRSSELFIEANKVIPGGVNSPVRAFKGVGGTPIFVKEAKGAYLYDEDGNRLIDYINSWGPMILGHAFEPVVNAVIEKAKKRNFIWNAYRIRNSNCTISHFNGAKY